MPTDPIYYGDGAVSYQIRVDGEYKADGSYSFPLTGANHKIALFDNTGQEITNDSIIWERISDGSVDTDFASCWEERLPCSYSSIRATYNNQTTDPISFAIVKQTANGWHIRINDLFFGENATILADTEYTYSVYYGDTKIVSGTTVINDGANINGVVEVESIRIGSGGGGGTALDRNDLRFVFPSRYIGTNYSDDKPWTVVASVNCTNNTESRVTMSMSLNIAAPISTFSWIGVSYDSVG